MTVDDEVSELRRGAAEMRAQSVASYEQLARWRMSDMRLAAPAKPAKPATPIPIQSETPLAMDAASRARRWFEARGALEKEALRLDNEAAQQARADSARALANTALSRVMR